MKRLLFTLFTLFLTGSLLAQNDSDDRTVAYLNGNLQVGVPLQEFRDNQENWSIGGGGLLAIRIGETPIYGGLELSGMVFDSETNYYDVNISGFVKEYEVKTNNSIFLGHLLLRAIPETDFPIRPYIDGMIGFKNLYTRTRLKDLDDIDEDDQESRIEEGDWAFSYGFAAGLQLSIFGNDGITLDLRCAYLPGNNANYLVRRDNDTGSVYDDPLDAFEKRSSPTYLLVPQIGLSFQLRSSDLEEPEEF
ncbi:MAG: hypothetical protein MRY78_00035 [Saprospiraceae bacterium]|nr:hypothetical protein [Saprospiraceae bacterium]